MKHKHRTAGKREDVLLMKTCVCVCDELMEESEMEGRSITNQFWATQPCQMEVISIKIICAAQSEGYKRGSARDSTL